MEVVAGSPGWTALAGADRLAARTTPGGCSTSRVPLRGPPSLGDRSIREARVRKAEPGNRARPGQYIGPVNEPLGRRHIAVACQGGGSHTAFTAGVLSHMFSTEVLEDYEFVGLSGTSGGAVCALMAWSALLQGRPEEARARLQRFWSANSTSLPVERLVNSMMLWGARVTESFTMPAFSPYDSFLSAWSREHLRTLVRSVVDFEQLADLATAPGAPLLMLGAVERASGDPKAFDSRHGEINADAVLASAVIPSFVSSGGGSCAYWEGPFSQNPPVRALMESTPDEIWVIQVNPTSIDYEPTSVSEIVNRRNELAGNLALLQELSSMEVFDELIDRGEPGSERAGPVTIRLLEMRRPPGSTRWGAASKLNRDPAFIRELITLGESQAADFMASIVFEGRWCSRDVDGLLGCFADGATVSADVPDRRRVELTSDPGEVRRFVTDHLVDAARIDLTRKRVYRESVAWEIRYPGRLAHHRGQAQARFRDGLITDFRLTTMPY